MGKKRSTVFSDFDVRLANGMFSDSRRKPQNPKETYTSTGNENVKHDIRHLFECRNEKRKKNSNYSFFFSK